jgi:hypothetical protein
MAASEEVAMGEKTGSSRRGLRSRLVDVVCGFLAYVGARLAWGRREGLDHLHLELLTFAAIYLLLQATIRGWKLARAGRRA